MRFTRITDFRGASLVCLVCILAAPVCRAQEAAVVRPLEYTRSVLNNGLVVLLNEDHVAPIVAVDVWYHIGAKDEPPGRLGFAHLCEHLMGEGSPNVSTPQKVFLQSIGARSTFWANTTEDITHYYYTIPQHQLETALWLESDRMAAPLTRADATHLGPVREVIKQERLQNRVNPVFGVANGLTVASLFPGDHPYGIDPGGPTADLEAATAGDVTDFCRPFYVPSNAVIALSGDLASAHAKALIEKYFSGIARGQPRVRRQMPATKLGGTTRVVLEDPRAQTTTLRLAWPAVEFAHPDRLSLVALGSLLSRDRTGTLSKLLVYDRGLAARVSATTFDFEQAGLFQIDIVPRPGASLTVIEQLVDSALASFDAQSILPRDLDAFKRSNAVTAITQLQTRSARADTLAHGEIFANDPVAYAKQVDRTFALTAADVQRVAKRYLAGPHVVMSMVPAGKLDLISKPELPYTNVTPQRPKATP